MKEICDGCVHVNGCNLTNSSDDCPLVDTVSHLAPQAPGQETEHVYRGPNIPWDAKEGMVM